MSHVDVGSGYALLFASLTFFVVLALFSSKFKFKNLVLSDVSYVSSYRSVSSTYIALSTFATAMGSWILFAPPEVGALYGCWAVILYALAVAIPMWLMMYVGLVIRNAVRKDCFAISDYAKDRYGTIMQVVVQVVSLFSMWISMVGELLFISYAMVALSWGISRVVVICSIALVTLLYTFYGGLKTSMITDLFQGILIAILTLMAIISAFINARITGDSWDKSATFTNEGVVSGFIMILSYLPAYLMDQGVWQRVLAGRTEADVSRGFLYGSFLVIPTMLLYGFAGILSKSSAGDSFSSLESASSIFFLLLVPLHSVLVGFVVILAVSMAASTIDSIQSAMPTIIANYIHMKGYSFHWAKLFTFLLNIPAVLFAIFWEDDVLVLYLISNVLSACVVPPLVCGLCLKQCNQFACIAGCIGGIVSAFVYGCLRTRTFVGGFIWFRLPEGVASVGTLYTFIVVFLSSFLCTLAVTLVVMYEERKTKCEKYRQDSHTTAEEEEKKNVEEADKKENAEETEIKEDSLCHENMRKIYEKRSSHVIIVDECIYDNTSNEEQNANEHNRSSSSEIIIITKKNSNNLLLCKNDYTYIKKASKLAFLDTHNNNNNNHCNSNNSNTIISNTTNNNNNN